MRGWRETCFLRRPRDHRVRGRRTKRTLRAARGMTVYHGRTAWSASRQEEVPEIMGSTGLKARGEEA